VGIQLTLRAESSRSAAIWGSATLTDDSIMGTESAFSSTMTSTDFCDEV
jgi:hypothetical protein